MPCLAALAGLCAVFTGRVRKHPPFPCPPLFGRFCGAFGRAEFFRASVGQPGKGDQNPIHKSAEFDEFYGLSQGAVLPKDYEKLWGEVSKVLRELSELVAK